MQPRLSSQDEELERRHVRHVTSKTSSHPQSSAPYRRRRQTFPVSPVGKTGLIYSPETRCHDLSQLTYSLSYKQLHCHSDWNEHFALCDLVSSLIFKRLVKSKCIVCVCLAASSLDATVRELQKCLFSPFTDK